jgi:hypothetical protein
MSQTIQSPVSATQTVVSNDTINALASSSGEPATQAVVSNDTTSAAPSAAQSAQGSKATYAAIEQLVLEREVWQENAFRTSNEQLYQLLQKCYAMYKAMEGGSAEAKALRDGLKDYINVKGYSFKSTHSLTKIVKCVFGADRRRVSAYSIVLRSALSKNISIMDVADFIRDAGGVEEIRLAKSPNAMSVKQKAAVATSTVAYKEVAVLSSTALGGLMNDAGKIGTNTVLIGTWQSDGSVVVRAVVESQTVLTAALASYYSSVKEAAAQQAAEQKAAAEAQAKQMAIAAAAASATVTATA